MPKPLTTPLKKPIGALAILNLADGLLTYWGLLAGAIEEANPLLSGLSPPAVFAVKLLLSVCLAAFLFTPLVRSKSLAWRYFLLTANIVYGGILLLHIIWVSFYYL